MINLSQDLGQSAHSSWRRLRVPRPLPHESQSLLPPEWGSHTPMQTDRPSSVHALGHSAYVWSRDAQPYLDMEMPVGL